MKAGAFGESPGLQSAVLAGAMLAPDLGDTRQQDIRAGHREFTVTPQRARVTAERFVTLTNSGTEKPTASAVDGSWTTGEIAPAPSVSRPSRRPAPVPAPPTAATIRGRMRS